MRRVMQSVRTHWSLLAMFLFVVFVFGTLSFRGERADHQRDVDAFTMCQSRNINVNRLNHFYHGMIDIEEHNPFKATSPATIARRITLYRGALLQHVDCGKDPR